MRNGDLNKYAVLLVLVSAASLGYYVPEYGLIYDGGLYASLGYSIQDSGSYAFNGRPGDVPPVYPIFLAFSIFILGEGGIFAVTPLFGVLLTLTVFYIFKKEFTGEFSEEIAFLGALLVLFTPPIFFYSIQVVRDISLLFFVLLSYLAYMKLQEDESAPLELGLGISMALAFLTKYAAAIYLLPIFVHALFNRKPIKKSVLTSFLIVLPWILWSYSAHDTLLVSHSTYLTSELGSGFNRFFSFILPLFILWSFKPMFLLSIIGLFMTLRHDRLNCLAGLFIVTLLIGTIWPEKDIRYVMIAFISVVYLGLVFLDRFDRKKVAIFLIIALVFQGFSTYLLVEANTGQNLLFQETGHWLRLNTPHDAQVMAHSYRQVNYFSHRITVQPPSDVNRLERYIDHYNISYVVVDTYEKYTPKYMYTYFNHSSAVKTFEDGRNEIMIYEVSK